MKLQCKKPRIRLFIYLLQLVLLCASVALLLRMMSDGDTAAGEPHLGSGSAAGEPHLGQRAGPVHVSSLSELYRGPFPDSQVAEGVQVELVDYHNHTQAQLDLSRVGLGEQGRPATLPDNLKKDQDRLSRINGFNGLLSDTMALDRALADVRHRTCATYKYYKHLPTVSVVIPFFEEQLSTLQRTIVSVINRSPRHLIKEIILVDDGSTTRDSTNAPLDEWLSELATQVSVIRLPERQGLITARLEGARAATGDVIVVLDSHCEVMNDWLPPLLNPIVEDYHTAVCPLIDIISWDTFAYHIQDNGARGGFDWHFNYKRIPLSTELSRALPKPFPNPIMNGGLFAISRKFFWELGGYDPGLEIWGGEQYNLSFKIWQCGGRLLDAPCSRVGHVFRGPASRPAAKKKNFIAKNNKRVALVWMDDYIEAMYLKNPAMRQVPAGDISGELALKERLKCKPFEWFLQNVAPDLVRVYPPYEKPDFASGTIKSVDNGLCLDTGGKNIGVVIIHPCHGRNTQRFAWCWRESIRIPGEQFCLEAPSSGGKAPTLYNCLNNNLPAKQKWRYNPTTKQLVSTRELCLEAVSTTKVLMTPCVEGALKQQWEYQNLNLARIHEVFPDLR